MLMSTPHHPLSQPENQKKINEAKEAERRIGEVSWEATFSKFNGPAQPIELVFSELPKSLQLTSMMDPQGSTPEQWSCLLAAIESDSWDVSQCQISTLLS